MRNKSVALLNIQRCDSHGAVLLAYALEKVLTLEGYDVKNLNYKYAGRVVEKNIIKRIIKKLRIKIRKQFHLSYIGQTIKGLPIKSEFDVQSENFRKFRQNNLHLTREITDVHDEILKDFDIFVVGSDVVWKPEIVACEDRELYFLHSVPQDALKISYAGSIGTDDEEVLAAHDSGFHHAFDSLDFVSVREQSMISFIQRYTDKPVKSVIDPVFLLTTEDYLKIEKKPVKILKSAYLYVYSLGGGQRALQEANRFATENQLSVLLDLNDGFSDADLITVAWESAISAGPSEFLYNMRHADYVITDSFHATAFAILFNKPFWVFRRERIGNQQKTSGTACLINGTSQSANRMGNSIRMADLLDRFSLSDRMYNGSLSGKEIDWNSVNKKIHSEREAGLKYLLGAFQGESNEK